MGGSRQAGGVERLIAQIAETEALLRRKKGELARASNSGAEVPASEIAMVLKLEVQLANLRAHVRLWEQTREG